MVMRAKELGALGFQVAMHYWLLCKIWGYLYEFNGY